MEVLDSNKKKALHSLSKKKDVLFITYNVKTKKFSDSNDINNVNAKLFIKKNNYRYDNEILLYIEDMFLEKINNYFLVIEAVKNSSFHVSSEVKDTLIKFISDNRKIDFISNEKEIIDFIQNKMKSNKPTQAKKYYNNILLRLKFTRLDLLERSLEEKKEVYKKAIERRDRIRKLKSKHYIVNGLNENNHILF